MRFVLAALLLGASALMVLAVLPSRQPVSAAPLAQATATPTLTPTVTPTPTPAPASGWEVVDQPGNVRCFWNTLNGQPFGGCVVVTP